MDKSCNFCGSPGNFTHQLGTCTGCINAINHLRSHGFRVHDLGNHHWHIALPTPRFVTDKLSVTTLLPRAPDEDSEPPVVNEFTSLESMLDYIINTTSPGGSRDR